jgi:hypothetical protein
MTTSSSLHLLVDKIVCCWWSRIDEEIKKAKISLHMWNITIHIFYSNFFFSTGWNRCESSAIGDPRLYIQRSCAVYTCCVLSVFWPALFSYRSSFTWNRFKFSILCIATSQSATQQDQKQSLHTNPTNQEAKCSLLKQSKCHFKNDALWSCVADGCSQHVYWNFLFRRSVRCCAIKRSVSYSCRLKFLPWKAF